MSPVLSNDINGFSQLSAVKALTLTHTCPLLTLLTGVLAPLYPYCQLATGSHWPSTSPGHPTCSAHMGRGATLRRVHPDSGVPCAATCARVHRSPKHTVTPLTIAGPIPRQRDCLDGWVPSRPKDCRLAGVEALQLQARVHRASRYNTFKSRHRAASSTSPGSPRRRCSGRSGPQNRHCGLFLAALSSW
jgi:hypothetical protein